ncbi:MAG: SLBB domain-containing protein [Pseudomonadota bacterium]
MKKLINILLFLVVILVSVSSIAQSSGGRFQRPMVEENSNMSFRKGDGKQVMPGVPVGMDDANMMGNGNFISQGVGLTYQVHVLGEVENPGTYRITASDRLSEVLQKAGGVNRGGSERNIEVRRQGEGSKRIDLLKFKLNGNLSQNPYLLDNDVVYIPLKKKSIQVVGAVNRPMEYEVKGERSLSDAINLAGGFSVGAAANSPIRVVRFTAGKKEVSEVPSSKAEMLKFDLQNGDVIFVPHVITEKNTFDYDVPKLPGDNIFYPSFEDRVFVLGGVNSPGAYPFNPYYKMSQYLSLSGGFSKMSTRKISVVSPEGKEKKLNTKNMDKFVINPGDTVLIGERRILPEGWVGIVLGVASFGLSATSTVLALTR